MPVGFSKPAIRSHSADAIGSEAIVSGLGRALGAGSLAKLPGADRLGGCAGPGGVGSLPRIDVCLCGISDWPAEIAPKRGAMVRAVPCARASSKKPTPGVEGGGLNSERSADADCSRPKPGA